MRKTTAALVLALMGMAVQAQGPSGLRDGLRDRDPVAVTASGRQIDGLDDIHTTADDGALVWVIGSKGYRFAADNGIDIKSGGLHACRTSPDGQRVRCVKAGHRRGDRFKYDINLLDGGGQELYLDPFILND